MTFTTRPEITGTFGVATSTHWIASAVGMSVLEKGGNAADAAVAMGFVLNVVEPQLNGPLGDLPLMVRPAGAAVPTVICAQGVAPAGATIAHYRSEGLTDIPGSGLLATVVPGAFDGWMLLLQDYGTMALRDVLEPAIYYAESGHPMLARAAAAIADLTEFFQAEWPTSAAVWLPGGAPPEPGALFRNPDLAATWKRLLSEAETKPRREAQIEAARDAFYRGFIAEAVGRWMETAEVMDAAGGRRKGVLTADDMARWSATKEAPLSIDYHGWTVWKTGVWGQGPLLLQALRILEGTAIGELDPNGPDFVHLVAETLKLAMADREAYYGDPAHTEIPVETLLSRDYAAVRRALLSAKASREQRPGRIPGFEAWAEAAIARAARVPEAAAGAGAGEPTMAHLSSRRGDTVHLDVIDRWGNAVTATPSGGWLQSSPVVPGLGRAAQYARPDVLAGRRAADLARAWPAAAHDAVAVDGRHEDGRVLAFGTPGGDQQDQWQLSLFLRLVHHRLNLQEAIDAPLFHTGHAQGSFYPRVARPGHLMAEPAFGAKVLSALRKKGHALEVSEPWAIGRLTAALREPDGLLRAAATPRLMQAYAIGR